MSDQIVSFDCPSCGGPLDHVHAVNNLVRCPYCSKNVIVPESLRVKPEPPQPPPQQVIHVNVGEPYAAVQASPEVQAQAKKAARWVSCLVIFILVTTVVGGLIAIAAPLLATGLVVDQLKGFVPGLRNTEFTLPEDAGPENTLATADAARTRVAELVQPTPTPGFYTIQHEFGEEGTGPGMFADSRWVAVAPDGSLFTAEYQDGRVQKFSMDGAFASLIQVKSKVPLYDIAVSRQGVLYVANQGEIFMFDAASGAELGQVAYAPDHYFESIAATADGGLVALSDEDTIVRFDAAGQVTLEVPQAIRSITGDPTMTTRVFVDGVGNIYLMGSYENSVFVFSRDGKFQNRLFSGGNEANQLRAVNDLVVDGKGRFLISDIKGVMVFSPDGQYQGLIDVQGAPFGLALDDQNRLYILTNAPRLYRVELN